MTTKEQNTELLNLKKEYNYTVKALVDIGCDIVHVLFGEEQPNIDQVEQIAKFVGGGSLKELREGIEKHKSVENTQVSNSVPTQKSIAVPVAAKSKGKGKAKIIPKKTVKKIVKKTK